MKIFKNLALISTLGVMGTALVLPLTSCSSVYYITPREADLKLMQAGSEYTAFPETKANMKQLLYGDLSYYDGDYVILIGSLASTATDKFLFNTNDAVANYDDWTKAAFYNGMVAVEAMDLEQPIGFSFYLDIPPVGDEGAFLPLATYSSEEAEKDDDDDIHEGDYKRDDQSAKQFRDLWFFIKDLYAPEAISEGVDSIIIAFNNGKPTFATLQTDTNSFINWLKETYTLKS